MKNYSAVKLLTKKSIFDVYRPFFMTSKVFGMGTFRFFNETFQTCRIGTLGLGFNLIFIAYLFIVEKKSTFSFSKVLSIGMIFVQYLPLVAALFFVVLSSWKRKSIHELFVRLDNFDKKVKIRKWKVESLKYFLQIEKFMEVRHTRQFLVLLGTIFLKTAFFIVQVVTVDSNSVSDAFRAVHSNGIFSFNFLPGITLPFLVLERFYYLNGFLETNLESTTK